LYRTKVSGGSCGVCAGVIFKMKATGRLRNITLFFHFIPASTMKFAAVLGSGRHVTTRKRVLSVRLGISGHAFVGRHPQH
jgi:hypothetical protein